MKKLLTVLLALTLLFTVAGCSKNESSTGDDTPKTEEKGGIAYFCRRLGDFGFNDNGWNGVQEAAAKYGYTPEAIELGDDTATFENALLDACDSGKFSVIVTQNGSGLGDYVRKYAPEFPEIKFIVFDMGLTEDGTLPENAYGIGYRASDACFLAGALAAKMSVNNKVAILSNDNPGGNDFAAGFVSGAKYANPDCTVYYFYGMADAAAWQEQAGTLYQLGCNVVLAGSGRFGLGVFNEAVNRGGVEAGYYGMGIDTDMYFTLTKTSSVEIANTILSSATKEIAETVKSAIDDMEAGTLEWGHLKVYGLPEGGALIAINDNYKKLVPQETQDYMTSLIEGMKAGTVKATSFYDFASQDAFLAWLNPQLGE